MDLLGISPTVARLHKLGLPVTVENWLEYGWPDHPDPVPTEIQIQAENAVRQYHDWLKTQPKQKPTAGIGKAGR